MRLSFPSVAKLTVQDARPAMRQEIRWIILRHDTRKFGILISQARISKPNFFYSKSGSGGGGVGDQISAALLSPSLQIL